MKRPLKKDLKYSSIDDDVSDNTGKFGTGFITTLLLSKIIIISGVYHNSAKNIYRRFTFNYDRDAETKD